MQQDEIYSLTNDMFYACSAEHDSLGIGAPMAWRSIIDQSSSLFDWPLLTALNVSSESVIHSNIARCLLIMHNEGISKHTI